MRIETAVIEIINACNLRCKHCYGLFEKQAVMPLNRYELYLRQLFSIGTTRLTITGGEPFLIGDVLLDYIKIAKNVGFPFIALTTNGTIQSNNIKEIIDNINLLQISVDGDQRNHDENRGKGTFIKTTAFIQKAAALCNSKVGVMMSLHKKNFSQLQFVHNFTLQYNVSFAVEIVTPCGRGSSIEVLDSNQMHSVKNYLKANNISCNDPITFCDNKYYKYFNQQLLAGCAAGVSALCIDTYGTVFPCARLRIPMGSADSGIDSIFESDLYKRLNNRTLIKGNCAKCLYLYSCGGCRARAFALSIDYLAEDKYCISYREKRSDENNT